MKSNLAVIGGFDSLASSTFYELIIDKLKKSNTDLNIFILDSKDMPDKVAYILDRTKKNPYSYLLRDCKRLESMEPALITIPCAEICYFLDKLENNSKTKISNMVLNTANYISNKNINKVALLAQTNTVKSKIYQKALEKFKIKCIIPDQNKMIKFYDKMKENPNISIWNEFINQIDADYYILGSPILSKLKKEFKLKENFIDPLEIEANYIIDFFK